MHQVNILPTRIHYALQQNLEDNSARTQALVQELEDLDRDFDTAGIRYIVLKGFSLYPDSVSRPELRSQLDLDLLLEPSDLREARGVLEGRGYSLHSISDRTWAFNLPNAARRTLNDLYRTRRFETIELHVAWDTTLFARAELKKFRTIVFLALPRQDVLLAQALHLFKHIRDGFARTAHFLEFRQNIICHFEAADLWRDLYRREAAAVNSWFSLGLSINLLSRVMGPFAPTDLTSWTEDRLPERIRLWSTAYAGRTVVGSFPGNKLHLLLHSELQRIGIQGLRSRRKALFPARLPPAIEVPGNAEDAAARLRRLMRQISFALFRFRFHLLENTRFLRESLRWRRQLRGLDG